ncbi:lytic transglycosylase domain-containing protein [Frigidibacter oleivorans]|uniref:lytic transglycosylase domain-containing protein n=1 Tax=Frigidibacter oleivorans TaxID=2487129 RepID=UPI001F288109|nr:lytic transglycosylase domain-containing protein [Frigidibacter oleivorans]
MPEPQRPSRPDRGALVARRASRRIRWRAALLAFALALLPLAAAASRGLEDPSQLCDQAAVEASRRTGVPLPVLRAIALTETGRRRDGAFRPWPWTVNMEGSGRWFDDAKDALAFAASGHARGARSFDIGCFQINYRWHGQNFASIGQMFDPLANGLYAARYLAQLHAEFGDWTQAAGAYHSRNPAHATRYAARFAAILADLPPGRATPPAMPGGWPEATPEIPDIPDIVNTALERAAGDIAAEGTAARRSPRPNRFPLLQGGRAGAPGSLVPVVTGSGGWFAVPLWIAAAPAPDPAEGGTADLADPDSPDPAADPPPTAAPPGSLLPPVAFPDGTRGSAGSLMPAPPQGAVRSGAGTPGGAVG